MINNDPFDFDPEFHRAIQSTPPKQQDSNSELRRMVRLSLENDRKLAALAKAEQQDSNDLLVRLRKHEWAPDWQSSWVRNPDGSEAVDLIEAMSSQLADARKALEWALSVVAGVVEMGDPGYEHACGVFEKLEG